MSSARQESASTQENEKSDLVIRFNSRSRGRAWDVKTLASKLHYNNTQAKAMGAAFSFSYDLKDAAHLSEVNRNLNGFFQQQVSSVKPYYHILKHVIYASPLAQLEIYIRQNPRVLLETFNINNQKGTLVEIAVIGLDQTIKNSNGKKLIEGTEEKLLQLHEELESQGVLPLGSYAEALEKANRAHLQETAEERDCRENNIAVLEKLFDVFIGDEDSSLRCDKKIITVVAVFKEFVKSMKEKMMTDGIMKTNQYHRNLVHLVASAFDVLSKRRRWLPIHEWSSIWDGPPLDDRFCIEVIGGAIELEFPPRLRQLVKQGLWKLFTPLADSRINRDLDVNGLEFKTTSGLPLNPLGQGDLSYFYDTTGPTASAPFSLEPTCQSVKFLQLYIAILSIKPHIVPTPTETHINAPNKQR